MVNLVAAQRPLLHGLMKMAGVRPYTVEIEPGTVMSFWVPSETLTKPKKKKREAQNQLEAQQARGGSGARLWRRGNHDMAVSIYVPDLLFFGGSTTDKPHRSPAFQAQCVVAGLRKLGVEKCIVVGYSYGGMVAFKMAEMYPEVVEALVITGSILAMTDSISATSLQELGFSSSSELLLPTSVKGLKALLTVASHKKQWYPNRLLKDYLEVMITNRKERGELLEALVVSDKDIIIPNFSQRIHLLWGENDKIFNLELAQNMKEQLGDGTTFEAIKKAGHMVNMERPRLFNRCLKQFIASFLAPNGPKK
ncbi:Epoxide hydrolase 3 [Glycine max]|nr:Epoxide hydrolase 3 [Glycine max]